MEGGVRVRKYGASDKAPALEGKGEGGKPGLGKPPVSLAATPTSPRTVVNENTVAAPLLTKTPAS